MPDGARIRQYAEVIRQGGRVTLRSSSPLVADYAHRLGLTSVPTTTYMAALNRS